jgi:hypothetical protein
VFGSHDRERERGPGQDRALSTIIRISRLVSSGPERHHGAFATGRSSWHGLLVITRKSEPPQHLSRVQNDPDPVAADLDARDDADHERTARRRRNQHQPVLVDPRHYIVMPPHFFQVTLPILGLPRSAIFLWSDIQMAIYVEFFSA